MEELACKTRDSAGNIIGSNIFNFAILFVADIFSFSKGVDHIYILNADSQYLLIFGIIATVTTLGMMLIKNYTKPKLGSLIGRR